MNRGPADIVQRHSETEPETVVRFEPMVIGWSSTNYFARSQHSR